MTPYFADADLILYCGDAAEVLRELPNRSVHMACTSPPFFGLRDYGTEGQIGLESSPDAWAARLVDVFREVRRVLRDEGTLWVECGDSYAANVGGHGRETGMPNAWKGKGGVTPVAHPTKPKDLVGQPWLLAFALRADGWYLRSCIVWSKSNAMPESVTDRPTTAHSYVFLLSKKPRYFYDTEALREPSITNDPRRPYTSGGAWEMDGRPEAQRHGGEKRNGADFSSKNARSVWTIPTEPNALAICRVCDAYWQGGASREHCGEPVVQHFAAFPRELVRRMILAGTSERGVCVECGAPWVREVERERQLDGELYTNTESWSDGNQKIGAQGVGHWRFQTVTQTLGWHPSCECGAGYVSATVLDCFAGSGTTLLVARQLGRHAIGVELNERYCAMTRARLAQLSLLAEA